MSKTKLIVGHPSDGAHIEGLAAVLIEAGWEVQITDALEKTLGMEFLVPHADPPRKCSNCARSPCGLTSPNDKPCHLWKPREEKP